MKDQNPIGKKFSKSRFTNQEKLNMILEVQDGKSVERLVQELDEKHGAKIISVASIYNWMKIYREKGEDGILKMNPVGRKLGSFNK